MQPIRLSARAGIGVVAALAGLVLASRASAQLPQLDTPKPAANPGWQYPADWTQSASPAVYLAESAIDSSAAQQVAATDTGPAPSETRVTRGLDVLPNTAGQVWRAYDISPYTSAVSTTNRPEQAVIEWITRETGTDMWFREPLGVLSASHDTLHVYHTPAVQRTIEEIVTRLNQSRGRPQALSLRLITVGSPNWRAMAYSVMQPITVSSPGVEGWMLTKESAAIVLNQLRRRGDYVEHSSGEVVISDGQKQAFSRTRPVSFVQSVRWSTQGAGHFEPVTARIDDGFWMELSALTGADGRTIDAVIRCDVDQVEKMQTVTLELPASGGGTQPIELGVPQLVSWRLNERFRWPTDQVLLLSCGVVATPTQTRVGFIDWSSLLSGSRGRADALLMIEYRGPVAPGAAQTAGLPPGAAAAPTR
jgi:hypothetical protein